MQLIITDAWLAKSRVFQLSGWQMATAFLLSSLVVLSTALGLYHWVLLKGVEQGWPIISTVVKLVAKDDYDQRDKFLRANLDVMARRLGELQAKLTQLDSLGQRVSSLAGVKPVDTLVSAGSGGVEVGGHALTVNELQATMDDIERLTNQRTDWLTLLESRLFERKMKSLMTPTQKPVTQSELGSPFGWRIDPITGRSALHTGQDFPAEVGTPIMAAAGGVVVGQEVHPEYGNMVEIDHGNGLLTRYAHCSRISVKKGDLIKRGQKIAEVGNSGRSTGPHLHFEVLVSGIYQDPEKFLALNKATPGVEVAKAQTLSASSNLNQKSTASAVR
jgi:murein DD-endopeptidase MepM/ murein hydrolase activator NlpD